MGGGGGESIEKFKAGPGLRGHVQRARGRAHMQPLPWLDWPLAVLTAIACLHVASATSNEGFSCEVPTAYTEAYLRTLTSLNCNRVSRTISEYERAIADGGFLISNEQVEVWRARGRNASAACETANSHLALNTTASIREAADYAVRAWSSEIMRGRECCIFVEAPYCVDSTWSTSSAAGLAPFAILIVLFIGSFIAAWFVPRPNREPAALSRDDSMLRSTVATPIVGPSAAEHLQRELEAAWMNGSCLRAMPGASDFASSSASLFGALYETFDFQADSVRNQHEHFLSLLRSQCAMVADRCVEEGVQVDEHRLLSEALGDLHAEIMDGFLRWRQQLSAHGPAEIPNTEAKVPSMGGAQWKQLTDRKGAEGVSPEWSRQLAEVVTYLLVWGEAGNLRFMPELIYFITELVLNADTVDLQQLHGTAGLSALTSGAPSNFCSGLFLSRIVRPLYDVVFDEWYDYVDVDKGNNKDKKKLREGFDDFLPPDVANYDDWNEFFCDPPRLVQGLLLGDGSLLFSVPHGQRFAALSRVQWQLALQAAEVKTHRELHSLWGVFASTHRVWLVHAVLFFSGLCLVTEDAPTTPDGMEPLGGRRLAVRLAAVGLLVPVHGLLWTVAQLKVAGRAVWSRTCGLPDAVRGLLKALLWSFPAVTYAAMRSRDDGSWSVSFCSILGAHYGVSILGLAVPIFLPAGLRYNLMSHFPRASQALSLAFGPPPSWHGWAPTAVRLRVRAVRYLFWLLVLAVKLGLGTLVFRAMHNATRDLNIALPGHQSPAEVASVYLTAYWIANTMLWLVLWTTAFLLFVADTQLWFTLGCTLLGVATVFVQRGGRAKEFSLEDAIAKIPERFSKKVLPYSPAVSSLSPHFPVLWDRIVQYMRYEDKIDNQQMGDLSFNPGDSGHHVYWHQLNQPLGQSRAGDAGAAGSSAVAFGHVKLPELFRGKTACESFVKTYCGVPDPRWPKNPDAQWRLLALARGLGLPMPRPFRVPYVPGITVLIPHYGESILMEKKELFQESKGDVAPLMDWLSQKYPEEFSAFTSRMQARAEGWPVAGSKWDAYSHDQWKKITSWTSMRMQTLWRTVAGLCLYHPALQCHYEAQADKTSVLAQPEVWNASDCFTCLVSMQMYKFFDQRQLAHTNMMFEKFPDCLKVAFIDCEDKGSMADVDRVHVRQKRRYYSCLIDGSCKDAPGGGKVPKLRIELPGYPILGDGKGDNQNHAIPFMRGIFSQCIDANQGAYFEQMMLLPCALGEFRSRARGDGLSKRIIGFPEHITSDIGSIGDFAATAEVAFGTILQRTYSVLGARMHYGHPDIMNKLYMMQQGGVSKATKTINLSEDIFAGMDFTLRGQGREIHHREYFHLAKGRDLGFNTVLGFFSKLSSGTGEQILTRQVFRLGQTLHLPEALTFYYAHAGYYLTQAFISMSMPLLVFIWLLVLLSSCESTFQDFQHCLPGRKSAADVMATALSACFSWLVLLFLLAASMPLFAEGWMERSLLSALTRTVKQLCTLSPLMFIFQAKIIGSYVTNEFRYGGATYVATGRGLPTERRPFIGEVEEKSLKLKKVGGLYLDYAKIAYYDGALLLSSCVFIVLAGGTKASEGSLFWVWLSLGLTIVSWLFAPFIFNPYQFQFHYFRQDFRCLFAFFLEDSGRHWVEWYDRTQLKPRQGFHQGVNDIAFFMKAVFLAAWYAALNLKVEALISIYSEYSYYKTIFVVSLVPPLFASLIYCVLAVNFETLAGCSGILQRRLAVAATRAAAMAAKIKRPRSDASSPDRTGIGLEEESEELPDVEEVPAHSVVEDMPVRPAPLARASTAPFWEEVRERVGCGMGIPLPVSAWVVLALDVAEAVLSLSNLLRTGWSNAFMAGLILKYGLLSICLFLGEGMLRSRCFARLGRLGLPLALWVRAHRMIRDILTSSLIFMTLTPIVMLTSANDYLCPGCNAHHLLIYRDPGHLAAKEALLVDMLAETPDGRPDSAPAAVADLERGGVGLAPPPAATMTAASSMAPVPPPTTTIEAASTMAPGPPTTTMKATETAFL